MGVVELLKAGPLLERCSHRVPQVHYEYCADAKYRIQSPTVSIGCFPTRSSASGLRASTESLKRLSAEQTALSFYSPGLGNKT